MADLTWKLSEIRAEARAIASLSSGDSVYTDAVMNARINDFYLNIFPGDVHAQELESFYEFDTASDDDCEQALPASVHTVEEPMTLKDSDDVITGIDFYLDKAKFFALYPEDAHDETDERGTPIAALLYNRTLYLRPKADEVFTFKAASIIKPTALSADTSVPLDVRWGPAIAQGTAVLIKQRQRDFEAVAELAAVYQSMLTIINRRDLIQKTQSSRAKPRF
jgi:hypothetical protein